MPQLSFESQARLTVQCAANDFDPDMSGPVRLAGRPCIVTLESGIQALVEIASFTYIEGVPLAIGAGLAENIDPADHVECGADGVRLKGVDAPVQSGPIDVKNHSTNYLSLPLRD